MAVCGVFVGVYVEYICVTCMHVCVSGMCECVCVCVICVYLMHVVCIFCASVVSGCEERRLYV